MKKWWVLLLCISMVFGVFGCSSQNEIGGQSNQYDSNAWEKGVANICRNENGYYAFCGELLYTIEDKKAYPLCNKADCEHDSVECNAYLKKVQPQTVWYDGTSIYAVGMGKVGTYSIYRINKDGSGNEKVCDLFQTIGKASFSILCYFNDGYAYYVLTLRSADDVAKGNYSEKLYRIKLEANAEPELLYEKMDGVETNTLGRCIFDEDDLYITEITYSENGDPSCVLYKYSIKENKIEPFMEKYMAYYFINEGYLYYTAEDGIYKSSLTEPDDEELIFETSEFNGAMVYDGEYIYVDDMAYQMSQEEHSDVVNICVLDLNGNIQKKTSVDYNCLLFYGDGTDIIAENKYPVNTADEVCFVDKIYFYDKSQINTDQDEWSYMEQKEASDLE